MIKTVKNFDEYVKEHGHIVTNGDKALWDAASKSERESCAKLMELSNSELRLLAGEMTAGEIRTVQAVLKQRAVAIRTRGE